MTDEELLLVITNNIKEITGYDKPNTIKYYCNKLIVKVKDYCHREVLNVPLFDFIEDRLIVMAESEKAKDAMKASTDTTSTGGTSTTTVGGIDINAVKSIARGDTTITLKDGNKGTSTTWGNIKDSSEYLEFTKEDYIILNRHRKLFKEVYD